MGHIDGIKCSRTACQKPHDNCVHSQTDRMYCETCAVLINRANPDYPDLVIIPRLIEYRKQKESMENK